MSGNNLQPLFSIIVPVYNDSKVIGATLKKIEAEVPLLNLGPYEIIVADDGSRDETCKTVETFIQKNNVQHIRLIHHEKNYGKGFSVGQGMLAAKGDYCFFTDSDLSTPLQYLKGFLEALKSGADVAIASRFLRDSKIVVERPLLLRVLSFCERLLIWTLSGLRFSDTQCGFKGFKKEAARKIFGSQKIHRFCFDVEALFLAKKLGYKIKVLPVDWYHDKDTRVRKRDMLIFVRDLLRIRWFWFKDALQSWRGGGDGTRK